MPYLKETWITIDNQEFDNEEEALAYEASLKKMSDVEHFLTEVMQCTDRKRAEYVSVFKQYYVWQSGAWETLQPTMKPRKAAA